MTCQISPFLTFQVLKIAIELENLKNFYTVLENIFLCFIMLNLMVIALKIIKLPPFIHLGP